MLNMPTPARHSLAADKALVMLQKIQIGYNSNGPQIV